MTQVTLLETKKILAEALQISVEDIKDNDSLDAYGKLDSLSFERLVLQVEKFLGFRIKAIDLLKLSTVQELADYMDSAKKA